MTIRRTPHGVPIPPNIFNGSELSPDNWLDPGFVEAITSPGVANRIDREVQAGNITPEQAKGLIKELRQFKRAMSDSRALPGEYLGRDDLPYQPMPFQNREQHRPDREAGPVHDVMRQAVERLDADQMTNDLVNQMSRNDPPHVHQTIRERAASEPTLHESIQASVDALGG